MGILTSRGKKSPERRVAEFWSWWAADRERVIASLQADRVEELVGMLDKAVGRLSKDVAWEVGPGVVDKPWQLVVTPGGVRAMLPFTIAWAEAAPPDDLVEFHPVRPPVPGAVEGAVLNMDGPDIALDETLVRVTGVIPDEALDIEVHHPAFSGLAENDQYGVAFHALDQTLGELVVMTCLRQIVPVTVRAADMIPVTALADVIREELPNPSWLSGPSG